MKSDLFLMASDLLFGLAPKHCRGRIGRCNDRRPLIVHAKQLQRGDDAPACPDSMNVTSTSNMNVEHLHACQVDAQLVKFVNGCKFSCTIADPALPDCPIVGCSAGFTSLTGYSRDAVVGGNYRFLLRESPAGKADHASDPALQLCSQKRVGNVVAFGGHARPWEVMASPSFDACVLQTIARQSGELICTMSYLRTVELDGNDYILGLQVEVAPTGVAHVHMRDAAFDQLSRNMDVLDEILSAQFWVQGTMRRQL